MSEGAEIKVRRRRTFTVIYDDLFVQGMSARAWGVFVYLLSKPDGWECRAGHLKSVFKEGRDALYAAIAELVELGYLVKEFYPDPSKPNLRRSRFVIDIDPTLPQRHRRSAPETEKPDLDGKTDAATEDTADSQETPFQDAARPNPDKAGVVSTEGTTTEVPSTEEVQDPDPSTSSQDPSASASPKLPGMDDEPPVPDSKPKRTAQQSQIPPDFCLTEGMRRWAEQNTPAVNPAAETAAFVLYFKAKGTRWKDWNLTWQKWMRKAQHDATTRIPSGRRPSNVHLDGAGSRPDLSGIFG